MFIFNSPEHQQAVQQLNNLWNNLQALADLARTYGIEDIFQDNGAKILQQLVLLNFDVLPGLGHLLFTITLNLNLFML